MGFQENDVQSLSFDQEQCFHQELENSFLKEDEVCLIGNNGLLSVARKEAVEWILRVNGHYGFSALTFVLAVNYFDRFYCSSVCDGKPWMSQLVAVACVSLAAKVEEIQVPLSLDLQVEECRYVFEAKTIQRMELLVLSTLRWRMHPVTPISFFDHIVRRFGSSRSLHREFIRMCEQILVSVIADSRFLRYRSSVLAAAIMLHVIKEAEPCSPNVCQNQLIDVLRTNEDEMYDCCKLIADVFVAGKDGFNRIQIHKGRHSCLHGSPDRVIGTSFTLDSSNDSWIVESAVSFMPEPQFKRRKVQD